MIQQILTKLSPTGKKLFYVASLFGVLALLDRLFFGSVMTELKDLEEKIHVEQGNIKKDLRFLAYKNRILKERNAFAPYFVSKKSTEDEIIAEFLKKIEILTTEANINVVKLTPLEGKQKKGYKEYSASLDCAGQLPNVVKFLHLIDTSDDIMKTVKFTLSAKKSESDEVIGAMVIAKIFVDPIAPEEGPILQLDPAQSGAGVNEQGMNVLSHNQEQPSKDSSPQLEEVIFSKE